MWAYAIGKENSASLNWRRPGMLSTLAFGLVIRVYDDAANVIETHEHGGDFKEP
jgi:hypothetical protein